MRSSLFLILQFVVFIGIRLKPCILVALDELDQIGLRLEVLHPQFLVPFPIADMLLGLFSKLLSIPKSMAGFVSDTLCFLLEKRRYCGAEGMLFLLLLLLFWIKFFSHLRFSWGFSGLLNAKLGNI